MASWCTCTPRSRQPWAPNNPSRWRRPAIPPPRSPGCPGARPWPGWIDSAGDADLRVAIRSGTLRGDRLELTAGAGLVRGSTVERELQEVALKLGVLQQQLNLPAQLRNNRSIV